MRSTIINIVMEIMRLIANSLTMSPIEDEIYYYKWWNMAMVVEKGLEIRSKSIRSTDLRCCGCRFLGFCGGSLCLCFLSPKASLYRGPFTKVVLFDLAALMTAI